MEKDYSKFLLELKPLLPWGYQQQITKNLADVKLWQVKYAFTNRQLALPVLKKIYAEAARIALEEGQQLVNARKATDAIKKLHGGNH